ncbi:hypothetical protein [Streptomyces sp. P9-A2]|uniref:hypothetical protein n=1 Tax=Streptomyces sp. P9-A2 TaxID=3072284 RepID=UPI002FC81E05
MPASSANARANWQSHIVSWTDGNKSRSWDDESYTEVRFKNCFAQNSLNDKVVVKVQRYVAGVPYTSYGTHTYTNCFTGTDKVSAGEWTGLASGSYKFETTQVAQGNSCCLLNVGVVYVDTTKADS